MLNVACNKIIVKLTSLKLGRDLLFNFYNTLASESCSKGKINLH